MITPDVLKALRVLALHEADEQKYEAWYKSICRWYSREFHTPLHVVEEMADEHVIRRYYEDTFWKLATGSEKDQEKFEQLIQATIAEGRPDELDAAEAEDEDWYQQELEALDRKLSEKPIKNNVSAGKHETNLLDGTGVEDPNLYTHVVVTDTGDVIPEDGDL